MSLTITAKVILQSKFAYAVCHYSDLKILVHFDNWACSNSKIFILLIGNLEKQKKKKKSGKN